MAAETKRRSKRILPKSEITNQLPTHIHTETAVLATQKTRLQYP